MANFEIYHNGEKINEANNFDLLANELSMYRKTGHSNITVYHPEEDGLRIDNQPKEQCGAQTGFFEFDLYGCWYEVQPDNGMEKYLMIGEYPYHY